MPSARPHLITCDRWLESGSGSWDRLALLVATTCQWDDAAEGERPHLTPEELEIQEEHSYGEMIYVEDPDARLHLGPQPSTSTAIPEAMDTTQASTRTQGAAGPPGPSE